MSSESTTEECSSDEIYGTDHDADFDSVVPDVKPDKVREAEQMREEREREQSASSDSSESVLNEDDALAMQASQHAVNGEFDPEATETDQDDGETVTSDVTPEALAERDERIDELESEVERLRAEKSDMAETMQSMREQQQNLMSRMQSLEKEMEGEVTDLGTTELDKWCNAPESMLDNLSANKRKAVILAKNWEKISWRADKGSPYNVNTADRANAKNHPGKLKYRLSQLIDEEPESATLYRIMKQVAKMSGGEEEIDTNGRTHITGGEFEYHEKPNPDQKSTKKVLEEVEL